ncbi:MAG: hypothetical protein RL033_7475 [Pseudomonadota bacterium]
MSTRPQPVTVWCLLAALSWSAPALAEGSEPAPASAGEAAAAQALFEQGRALMAKGKAEEACSKFEESQRLEPAIGTEFNLASCYEKIDRLASAYALFMKVAATARSSQQKQREEVARERAEALRPQLTTLTIEVPEANRGMLRVERDGNEVGEAQWGFPVPVDPGPHRVRAFGGAIGEWTREVVVPSDGGVHRVVIPEAADARGNTARLPNQTWAIVSASVGVAGLATGGLFSLLAVSRKNSANDQGCKGTVCPTAEGVELRDSAHSAGNVATVGLAFGVVGLAGAAALLWWLPELGSDGERHQLALVPVVVPGGSAVVLDGRF